VLFIFNLLPRISQPARTPRSAAPMTPTAMPAFVPLLKLDDVTTAGDDVEGVVAVVAGEPVVEVLAPDAEVWELVEELVVLDVVDDAVMLK
jgi:hypothetical protein